MKTNTHIFQLNGLAVDAIGDAITEFCQQVGANNKDMLRYRLSAEECLLYWMEHGLRENEVSLQTGSFMRMPYVMLEVEGPGLNPYEDNTEGLGGEFAGSVLTSLGLNPEYSHAKGRNRIRFRVKGKSLGQIPKLCIALGAAALVGAIGMVEIPEAARTVLLDFVINPLYDSFFKLLGCIAGPMIFLSVVWGIYGIGDADTFGRIGRNMLLKYVLITFGATVACLLYFPLLGSIPSAAEGGEVKIDAIAEMIFGIIPANIVEPFATGNTLQIIFLAIVVGIALLYLGRKANGIAWAVDQVNTLVQMLMQALSQLVPYVIFLVMVSMVWSGKLSVLATSWELFAATLSAVSLITLVFVVATCVRMKVSPVVLIRKCVPTFVLALSTASSAAAFGTIVETCERRFGIDESIVKFGVPLGIVIEKPATAAFFLLLVFFLADQYDVTCSISWICIAVFVSAVVAIASPPVPGGAAVALTALFIPVGIPMEALAIALAIDIVIDFFKTAFQMTVLQLSLVNISAGMDSIDANVLRDPEA